MNRRTMGFEPIAIVGQSCTLPGALTPQALWANVLAFLVAFVVSYNGHALLTFSAAQARGWPVVAKFFAVACLSFIANEALYYIALNWLHWHYFWSLAAVLVLVAIGTFVMSKFWAFKASSTA
jgi:putative flippase GtrA